MSKRILFLVASLAAALPAADAAAQSTEVGVLSGLSVFTAPDEDAVTVFGVPGSFVLPTSSLYITTFPTPNLALEPQVGVMVVSGGGDTDWLTSLGAQLAYHSRGGSVSSPYFGGNASWVRDFAENNNFTLGAAAGYRAILAPGLGVRVELGYRRWFTGGDFDPNDVNQFTLQVGVGGLVGG